MSLRSFLSALRNKWSGLAAPRRRTTPKPRRRLELEALETRLAPAVPKILAVTPLDYSTTSVSNPTLTITFSEPMFAGDISNPNNYLLFNSEGQAISVDSATPNGADTQVTIGYNGNATLPADSYTLFVRGDQVHDATDMSTIALPGQLVVANSNTGNVSTLNAGTPIAASGTTPYFFDSVHSYPLTAANGFNNVTPVGIVARDFDRDGNIDIAVVNNGTKEVDFYAGHPNGVYDFTPTLRVSLPAASNPVAVVAGNFNFDGKPDLAVADSTGNVDVLVNTSAATIAFANPVAYAAGAAPVAIATGDFDGNGRTDLVVANDADVNGAHSVTILPGNGNGTFGGAIGIQVGADATATTPTIGIVFPDAIAVGNLSGGFGGGRSDIVVGGSNGAMVLRNASTGAGNFNFNTIFTAAPNTGPGPFVNNVGVTHLAVDYIRNTATGAQDIVLTTNGGSNNLRVYSPSGMFFNNYTLATQKTVSGGATGLLLQDLGNGQVDVIVTTRGAFVNSPATNGSAVGVFVNTSLANAVALGAEQDYGVDSGPVALDSGDVDGDGNPDIVTANNNAPSFTVVRGNGDGTLIQAATNFAPSGGPTSIVMGDVDGDGIPDIVVASQSTNNVSIFLGDASGGFTLSGSSPISTLDANSVGAGPVGLILANLTGKFVNNDPTRPILDIVTADSDDNTVSILANDGFGNFSKATTVKVGVTPTGVTAADFNKDGKLDLAVSHNSNGAVVSARGVTILLGNGNRTFQPAKEILSDIQATAVLAGDFFVDSTNAPDLVVVDQGSGSVILERGDGTGNFVTIGSYRAAPNISALVAGDVNRDGSLDVIAVSQSTTTLQQITVLLGTVSNGFRPPISTVMPFNEPLASVALTDITPFNANDPTTPQDFDAYPDLVVGTIGGFPNGAAGPIVDNIYTLTGNGDGSFRDPVPYEAGGEGQPGLVAVSSDALVRVTTFHNGGDLVNTNLIRNGDFEQRDLNNEQGNLTGWKTAALPDSRGGWLVQTGTLSPLSQTTEPAPGPPGKGIYQAMLDQSNLQPVTTNGFNPNNDSTYKGSNFLYQDVSLPTSGTITLSLDLLIDPQGTGFTNPSVNPSLDYTFPANDYQVRVDILDASDTNIQDVAMGTGHVLLSVFGTNPSTPLDFSGRFVSTLTANLSAFAGKTVRLRIAAVTNIGQLIVGVDNVSIKAVFHDTANPNPINGLQLRNPGLITNTNSGTQAFTTDPTLVGQVGDVGSALVPLLDSHGNIVNPLPTLFQDPNNIAFVAFDINHDGDFNGGSDLKTDFFDANGNFTLTLPTLSFGLHTIGVRVQDKAGHTFDTTFTFTYQGPSTTVWQAVGPGPIDVSTVSGLQFPTVAGRITSIALDPRDPTGQTYYVGAANGGVWKTSDGGNNWTPLTDFVTDANGNPIATPIGGVGVGVKLNTATNAKDLVLYAATGDGDIFPDSQPGFGVLKSTNDGASWTVAGGSAALGSGTVLANARVSKVVVDPNNPDIVYVAVISGGLFGPGVYKTTNGGTTWIDVLSTAAAASSGRLADNMNYINSPLLPAGTAIASVTDLIIDPADSTHIIIGLGNIGIAPSSTTGGVWESSNSGNSWQAMLGGQNPNIGNGTGNNFLPGGPAGGPAGTTPGTSVGRVTLAEGDPRLTNDQRTYYVLIGTPPSNPAVGGGFVNYGGFMGLYKSSDGGANFTKVMLRQPVPQPVGTNPPLYQDIDLLGGDASNTGALAVDPTDPNVVYVGGAVQNLAGPFLTNHGLIRVDTGNMRDIHYVDVNATIPNDGDDITKWNTAHNLTFNGLYPIIIAGDPARAYIGEGVSWYDLSQDTLGKQNNRTDRLPADVRSLAVDGQGRLVIGTEQGLYRAIYHGAGYDYTSGGQGILTFTGVVAPASSVQITTINGNLQIADLTSVAIDPLVAGRIYTTEWGTGSAVTSGSLNWETSGLRGPLAGGSLGGGDGDVEVVAPPDPNAPAGTLATVYRNFAYNGRGFFTNYQPEISTQGGALGTYQNLPIPANLTAQAGYLPPLVIFPQKIFNSSVGNFQDELAFGTDRVYTSLTSGTLWLDKVGRPLSPLFPGSAQGFPVTAIAFSPTTDQVIYAATSDGKLFATFNSGADGWLPRSTGLPVGGTITSIVVDANNTQVAFVTVNGGPAGSGHVFRTINGGVSWTNIAGATSGLPNVNAYALTEDPRSQPQSGAPNGRIYVGTQTGVYVTTDGVSWTRLGAGLPNVPVVALQFNKAQEILVAGTNGRGAFKISTDRVGPRVVAVTPATPVLPGLTSVTVTFNETIDPTSFTPAQIDFIKAPNGALVDLSTVTVTDVSVAPPFQSNPHNVFQITFQAPGLTLDGVYTFQIGPSIKDVVGNKMDQNQNGFNGEDPADRYTFTVVVNSTDNGQFVSGLYHDLLSRPPDTVGFQTILAPIDAARASLLSSLATTYVLQLGAPQLIKDLYSSSSSTASIIGVADLLGRVAQSSEVTFWTGRLMSAGISFEQIIVSLTSDVSYFLQNRPGHNVNGMDSNFVNQIYLDLLHRLPSTFEHDLLFVPQLTGAESTARTQDARALLAPTPAGTPYLVQVIGQNYQTFLNRAPSQAEIGLWLNNFSAGATQEQLIAALLGSGDRAGEFYTTVAPALVGAPASDETWARAAYMKLFPNYPFTQGEIDFQKGQLANGTQSFTQVASVLVSTDLYRFGAAGTPWKGAINALYVKYMGRPVISSELNHWVDVYAANPNYRTEDLIAAILGSPEYFGNHVTANTPLPSQDAQWTDALYTSVLGGTNSSAEASDRAFLSMAEFNARASVGSAIVSSGEYIGDVTNFVYNEYLGRSPGPSEFAHWAPIVGKAAPVVGGLNGDEQLVQALLSSQDYFLLQSDPADGGLHTNNSWLTSLYGALRSPFDATSEASNLSALIGAYAPTRLNAIHAFTLGAEYRTDFITAQYNTFLGRAPAAGEITLWLNMFQGGTTQEQLIASLMGSSEYFARAPIILGAGSPSNDTFVRAAYKQLFPGYSIKQSDLDAWVPRLNAGTITRQQVAAILDTSSLYRFGGESWQGTINQTYFRLLGRNAMPFEINYWMSVYANNPAFRTEDFIAAILDSQEYFQLTTHTIP